MYLGGFNPDDHMLPYISTCTPLICLMYLASSREYICLPWCTVIQLFTFFQFNIPFTFDNACMLVV